MIELDPKGDPFLFHSFRGTPLIRIATVLIEVIRIVSRLYSR